MKRCFLQRTGSEVPTRCASDPTALYSPGRGLIQTRIDDSRLARCFVEPANLSVHSSALRRTPRNGGDGNRFIINIPGRGYSFVALVAVVRWFEQDRDENRAALPE